MAGNATIGALRVVLGLDSAQFEKGLKNAKELVSGFDIGKGLNTGIKNLEEGLHEAASRLGGFGTSLAAMGGVGLAAAAALGSVAEALHKTSEAIEAGAEIGKLANTVGVTTDFLQKFNFAARQSDVDVAQADEALKNLNVTMGLVEKGLARAATTKAFTALGFTPEQLRGFSDAGEFIPALADAIQHAGNAAEQAAIAKKLGVSELLPLLKEGGEAFDALARKAQDLGIVMSASLVQKAEEAEKKLAEISDVTKAQANVTFVEFADTIITVKEAFLAAEKAGLSFLASITNTTPVEQKLDTLRSHVAQLEKEGIAPGAPGSDRTSVGIRDKVRIDQLNAQINALELVQINDKLKGADKAGASNAVATGALPDKAAKSNLVASDQAIATAQKAELDARIALTGDIAQLAVLRQHEVDVETANANKKLQDEANEKKITQAAAAQAIALNNTAALERKALIVREATFAAQNAELDQREAISRYSQQAAQIEESLAATVEARNAIETKALADQQAIERDRLTTETDQKVLAGKLTVAKGLELLDAQKIAQIDQARQLAEQQRVALIQQAATHEQAGLELQVDLLSAQANLQKSTFGRNVIEERILALQQQIERSKAQEAVDTAKAGSQEREDAQARLAALPEQQAAQRAVLAGQTRLIDAIGEASSSAQDLAAAFKAHNWARVFDDFQATIQTVEAAFASQGKLGGTLAAGSAIGSAVGGHVGGAIADGFGIAALGAAAGDALFSSTVGAAFSGAIGGGLANLGLGLSSLLGPIGIIAGIGVALAGLIGSKPSNQAAISTLTDSSFAISGNKRNDQTTNLATSASTAVLQGEKLLTDAGIKLGATVQSIDIGVRDATHIMLSNGQALSSAVGNAAAAAEAGLRGVLQNATYTSDAEKQLVDSMLAAGKGFDDIATALQAFDAAQLLGDNISDTIQKLLDPQAYDVAQLKAAQTARAAQVQAAADAGYLTAQQLSDINDQLGRLDKLELDQVLQKYADAASQAADELLNTAKSNTAAATQALESARDAAIAPLSATISRFQALADNLRAYRATLDQAPDPASANLSSLAAAFNSTAARARLGDADAAGALQGISEQYRTAAIAQAHTAAEAAAVDAKIKGAVSAAADTATRTASIAQQQLDALNAQVDGLLNLNAAVLTIPEAIQRLQDAQAAEAAALQATLTANFSSLTSGQDNGPAPTIPAPDLGDPALLSPPTTSLVDPANLTGIQLSPDVSAAIAGQVAAGLGSALNQIALNTNTFAAFAEQWDVEGLLTRAS